MVNITMGMDNETCLRERGATFFRSYSKLLDDLYVNIDIDMILDHTPELFEIDGQVGKVEKNLEDASKRVASSSASSPTRLTSM